jgi:DNA mismatch endonuclease, patch repair protein
MQTIRAQSASRPEDAVYRWLRDAGVKVRRHARLLPGSPDLVIFGLRCAIFVDGDFWHGRAWFERSLAPRKNRAFWIDKFEGNRKRDRRVDRELRQKGWYVIRVWESDVVRRRPHTLRKLLLALSRRETRAADHSLVLSSSTSSPRSTVRSTITWSPTTTRNRPPAAKTCNGKRAP